MAASTLRDAVDWSGVHLWWGDERFLPSGDPERNETGARRALLDALPMPADHVHPIPGPDLVATPEVAARRYADELASFASEGAMLPQLDVVLVGMGPDGHVASLFPGAPALEVADRPVVAVHDSPKPPSDRVSLTFPALATADEVWVVAAGPEKADAVSRALSGDDRSRTPASAMRGTARTLWLLDLAAAGGTQ